MLLAGDIGGTKSRLSLFKQNKELTVVKEEYFRSEDFPSLLEVLKKFLGHKKHQIERACFGIPGPVREGVSYTTNLPWIVNAEEISKVLNIPKVYLINDLEACAYGISILSDKDLYVLNEGKPNQKGNIALISAGTGLGEAGLYWNGSIHKPFPSEGGHCDFAPRDEKEIELLQFLRKKYSHISYERLVSGPGIYNIYEFLLEKRKTNKPFTFEEEIKRNVDPPKLITQKGISGESDICEEAIDWFISLYGAEAGNFALKLFAISGVYLGGGIVPVIIDKLKKNSFMKAFIDKGRFSSLMKSIPVKVILNKKTALLGAARYALMQKKS